MAKEIKLPDLGENIEAGDVISVLVKEGDEVQAEQGIIEVETGKAVVEVPCPEAGRVTKIHVKKGDKVPVGATIISLEGGKSSKGESKSTAGTGAAVASEPDVADDSDDLEEAEAKLGAPKKKAAAKKSSASQPAAESQASAAKTSGKSEIVSPTSKAAKQAPAPVQAAESDDDGEDNNHPAAPAGPATRRLARELGVSLERVSGSGRGGRITKEDVMAAVRQSNSAGGKSLGAADGRGADQDKWGPVRVEQLTGIRKTIATHMARSASTIPHVTNFDDADITELERIRKGSMADFVGKNVKLTVMSFVLKSVAHAIKLHPAINASLDLENGQVIYKNYVNLGVAVDTERGLVVPVIRDVDHLTIPQIAQSLAEMANQARAGQFTTKDLQGGTFTISNLGVIGGTYSTPIINYPEVAILLVGRGRQMPVVVGEKIEIRTMLPLSLSYDHRWIDGAVAGRFLNELKAYLEVPARLLLAP